ncbi:hypothetical protein D9M72_296480 [compost metagenome]
MGNIIEEVGETDVGHVELDDAGIDGREIQDVVDDRQQQRRGGGDVVDILRLPLVEIAESRRLQQVGEADDVGERRAKLVGNVVHEVVLQRIRLAQRLVLFGERALDPDAVGDVDEGQHRLRVRQRDDGVVEDQSGPKLKDAAAGGPFVVEAGDDVGETLPPIGLVVGDEAGLFDRPDMGAGLGFRLADAPDRAERRVRQANAAIGPKHGDAFGEMVDRLALNLNERIVARFEIDLLGQVLEHPGDPALRAGGREDAQRLAVRQVPEVALRVERLIDGKRGGLPLFPVELLRQLAAGAQPVKHFAIVGLALEEADVEVPQTLEGLVVELQALIAVEDRDGGRQMIERFGMALERPVEFLAHGLDAGYVDGDAGRAGRAAGIDDFEEGAVAPDDGRNLVAERCVEGGNRADLFARDGCEQLAPFGNRDRDIRSLDGVGIGLVDPGEGAIRAALPHRQIDGVEKGAEGHERSIEPIVLKLQLSEFCAHIVESDEAYESAPARDPSLGLQDFVALRFEHQVEAARLGAQRVDRIFQFPGGLRLDPAAEGQELAVVCRRAGFGRQLAEQLSPLEQPVPDDDPAVLVGHQRLIAREALVGVRQIGAQFAVLGFDIAALADQPDRRNHRCGNDADEHGEGDDLRRAEDICLLRRDLGERICCCKESGTGQKVAQELRALAAGARNSCLVSVHGAAIPVCPKGAAGLVAPCTVPSRPWSRACVSSDCIPGLSPSVCRLSTRHPIRDVQGPHRHHESMG